MRLFNFRFQLVTSAGSAEFETLADDIKEALAHLAEWAEFEGELRAIIVVGVSG